MMVNESTVGTHANPRQLAGVLVAHAVCQHGHQVAAGRIADRDDLRRVDAQLVMPVGHDRAEDRLAVVDGRRVGMLWRATIAETGA